LEIFAILSPEARCLNGPIVVSERLLNLEILRTRRATLQSLGSGATEANIKVKLLGSEASELASAPLGCGFRLRRDNCGSEPQLWAENGVILIKRAVLPKVVATF
jgi:hypothetical protein